jgi:hypothetical protein
VPVVHEVIGYAIVGAFAVLMLWGFGAWIVKREPGRWYWTLLAVVQVTIGIQVIAGLILLAIYGIHARPVLHYLYGSLFPIVVLVIGHVMARDMERDQWKVFAVAAFICFGLTLRALFTGLGIG